MSSEYLCAHNFLCVWRLSLTPSPIFNRVLWLFMGVHVRYICMFMWVCTSGHESVHAHVCPCQVSSWITLHLLFWERVGLLQSLEPTGWLSWLSNEPLRLSCPCILGWGYSYIQSCPVSIWVLRVQKSSSQFLIVLLILLLWLILLVLGIEPSDSHVLNFTTELCPSPCYWIRQLCCLFW